MLNLTTAPEGNSETTPLNLRLLLVQSLMQARDVLERNPRDFLAVSFPGMDKRIHCPYIEADPLPQSDNRSRTGEELSIWPEEALVSVRWPALLFALEGECDMRFGVTIGMRQLFPALKPSVSQFVTTVKKHQFLLIPSGFPRPDGTRPHWERPDESCVDSTLLWLVFFPTGCFAHFCRTHEGGHSQSKSLYLPISRSFRVAEEIEREILHRERHWIPAVRHNLQFLLLLLQRQARTIQIESGTASASKAGASTASAGLRSAGGAARNAAQVASVVLQHACEFIDSRLQEPLYAPMVAEAVGLSVPRLNALFQKNLQTTLMQYVIGRRIEIAKTMLCETNLSVATIAAQTGFTHIEHFSRTFRRHVQDTPLAYRRRFQDPDPRQSAALRQGGHMKKPSGIDPLRE